MESLESSNVKDASGAVVAAGVRETLDGPLSHVYRLGGSTAHLAQLVNVSMQSDVTKKLL